MKKFLKILLSIIIIYNLLPSILGDEPSIFKKAQIYYLAKKYGGVYIFDKALYDEIVFLEKQIKELDECYKNQKDTECVEVVKRQLTTDGYYFNDYWQTDRENIIKEFGNHDENTTLDLVALEYVKEKRHPLSVILDKYDNYREWIKYDYDISNLLPKLHKDKIMEIIGENNYKRHLPIIAMGDRNFNKNDIVSVFLIFHYADSSYVLQGDEGAGFILKDVSHNYLFMDNVFYVDINTSKDKNDLLK